jgi:hypothetical protein
MSAFDAISEDLMTDFGGLPLSKRLLLRILGQCDSVVECVPKKLSGRRLTVHLAKDMPDGTCVRIDYEDSLLLGEVVRCWQGGAWIEATIELQHSLVGIAKLRSVLDEVNADMAV